MGDASAAFKRAFRLEAVEGATTFADLILRGARNRTGPGIDCEDPHRFIAETQLRQCSQPGHGFYDGHCLLRYWRERPADFCRTDGKFLDAGNFRMTVRNSCSATLNAVAGINSQSTGMCYCDSTASARACAICTRCRSSYVSNNCEHNRDSNARSMSAHVCYQSRAGTNTPGETVSRHIAEERMVRRGGPFFCVSASCAQVSARINFCRPLTLRALLQVKAYLLVVLQRFEAFCLNLGKYATGPRHGFGLVGFDETILVAQCSQR